MGNRACGFLRPKLNCATMSELIRYNYLHSQTESTTGYFSCLPDPLPGAAELLRLLAERPLDSFLRRYAIGVFAGRETEVFSDESPLLHPRRATLPDAPLHAAWAEVFNSNIQGHKKIIVQDLPPLFTPELLERHAQEPKIGLADLPTVTSEPESLMPAAEVAELALERLQKAGALAGPEQRHIASLSPIALLMPWKLDIAVRDGRNSYSLKGQANTYGRGLSLAQCRASCRMEMVERFSAYLSIADGEVKDRAAPAPLKHARRSEFLERGEAALDPNEFYIEAPYLDQELVWISGLEARRASPDAAAYRPVWVPLQMAALFSNCDEIDLASAPGSTGIATGSVMEQARLAALTEILERDAEATTLYHKSRCFQLDPDSVGDEALAALLYDYRALGINLQFMDLTGPLGLPCYQAFVIGPKGGMHRGHGASLSGPRAVVSAISETPYPYPEGGPSGPMLRNLPLRRLSDLPDYSSGSVKSDLALLESMLCANGLNPVYVELTHATLKFPVVRALIPGRQLAADFDDFTRLSPRLYKDYLKLIG